MLYGEKEVVTPTHEKELKKNLSRRENKNNTDSKLTE